MSKVIGTAMPSAQTPTDVSRSNDSSNQVTAMLLDVLRNINREVKTTQELNSAARRAMEHYRDIAQDLSTLSDTQLLSPPSTRC